MGMVNFKLKINPTITINIGESRLGTITFDNLEDMGKFIRRLGDSIKHLIEEFEEKKG